MNNFERMLAVVNETFDTRHDPDQISVSPEERSMLEAIHPDTMSELANEDGPVVWLLLVPTTRTIMEDFLKGTITEKQLLYLTPPGAAYDVIYLCSASVLPEFRRQGLAGKLSLEAIARIRQAHTITALFYWPFSNEGRQLAVSIAQKAGVPLYEKVDKR